MKGNYSKQKMWVPGVFFWSHDLGLIVNYGLFFWFISLFSQSYNGVFIYLLNMHHCVLPEKSQLEAGFGETHRAYKHRAPRYLNFWQMAAN
jgi:hypothetical protein